MEGSCSLLFATWTDVINSYLYCPPTPPLLINTAPKLMFIDIWESAYFLLIASANLIKDSALSLSLTHSLAVSYLHSFLKKKIIMKIIKENMVTSFASLGGGVTGLCYLYAFWVSPPL